MSLPPSPPAPAKRGRIRSPRAALLALALVTPGCLNPPAARIDAAFGEVGAATPEEAHAYAARAEAIHDRLLEVLPDTSSREACVWVFDDATFYERHGQPGLAGQATWDTLGWSTRIEVAASTFDTFVAHEWVHVLLGPSWAPLPGAIEEGLANEAAFRVGDATLREAQRLGYLRAALRKDQLNERLTFRGPTGERTSMTLMGFGGPEVGPPQPLEDLLSKPGPRSAGHFASAEGLQVYGVGTLLVEAIVARSGGSFARLHRACLDHEGDGLLATTTLLGLAGFSSAEAFQTWLDQEFAAEAARRFFADPDSQDSWIDHVEGRLERTLDARAFLDLEPAYQLEDRDPVWISEDPELRRIVIERWPSRTNDSTRGSTR